MTRNTTDSTSADEIKCSCCGRPMTAFPEAREATYYVYDGVFCSKCNKTFCRLCIEFQFLNGPNGATHAECGGNAKLIRTMRRFA